MANNPLHMTFCGLEFASPIVLLSGCVDFGEEYTRVEGYSNADVGAVCLKGTTGQMRLGNPPHRVYETPDGMLNAIGLQNPWRVRTGEPRPGKDCAQDTRRRCHRAR
jgi:dihydroorotate dehydrogenase (NAD+) catalytic subunit